MSIIHALRANGTLTIYDQIGAGGITAKDFNAQLGVIGPVQSLTLRINSPGGDLLEASAIYTMLNRLKPATTITVYIDGVAASAASFIAMVGDVIVMPANAFLMLHDPSQAVVGTAEDMRETIANLDRFAAMMAGAYAAKSGLPTAAVMKIMSAETWFTAAEAVAAGFADILEGEARIAAHFDLTGFLHPPGTVAKGELDVSAAWAAYRAGQARWIGKAHGKPTVAAVAREEPTTKPPRLDAYLEPPAGLDAKAIMAAFNASEIAGGRK
jgi:ATP-dependent Clp protease protease subunit